MKIVYVLPPRRRDSFERTTVFERILKRMQEKVRKLCIMVNKFGNPHFWASVYENTGMDFFGSFYGKDAPTFYDIKDANKVYEMVNKLRNRK